MSEEEMAEFIRNFGQGGIPIDLDALRKEKSPEEIKEFLAELGLPDIDLDDLEADLKRLADNEEDEGEGDSEEEDDDEPEATAGVKKKDESDVLSDLGNIENIKAEYATENGEEPSANGKNKGKKKGSKKSKAVK